MATGRPIREVLYQPASLTLWTFLQLADVERVERLVARDARFDLAQILAAAVLDGRHFNLAQTRHLESLRRHPDREPMRELDLYVDHLKGLDDFAARNWPPA